MKQMLLFQLRSLKFLLIFLLVFTAISFGQNPIVQENLLSGTPQDTWYANEGGPIVGFAQEFSVNKGETVHFKINIESSSLVPYTVQIYRIGWYQGNGARFIADLGNSLTGKSQPAYNYETATGKVDCNNWAVSTQWAVPNNSSIVSGVYIARFDCPAVGGTSIQAFVVRDDAANSPILFKTSDATWQAYNSYGGNTFYTAATPVPGFTHATKISYQRPVYIRGDKTSFFNSEYPMIRFMERNGYNVSYTTDLDMARSASPITPANHRLLISVGHDEYWSIEQRSKYEAARAAGVNIAFFSGNEMYWKTRWEDNYQTLVCYKEGTEGENVCGSKCDPLPNVWTGLWRSGCSPTYASNDGCKPEGSFSGQMSWTQSFGSIQVPDTYKKLRMWRNTSIASLAAGQTATFPYGTLGSEWDPEQFTETYPAHRIVLSKTSQTGLIHKMSLYRHSSGALIFAAGTMNWSWGLDDKHENGSLPASADMQQGTINILHDLSADPGSIQPGMVMPTIGGDVLAPSTTITSPGQNAVMPGTTVTITGSSVDNGNSAVAGVEVSIDNGTTWHTADGLENWTYTFSPTGYGTKIIKVRAWDDLGNVETVGDPGSPNSISISFSGPFEYAVFNSGYPAAPPAAFTGNPVELGMKFRSSIPGFISGFRYYKAAGITGMHTGHLWTSTGTLLATKTFDNETASGWQSVSLATPVAIDANTTYVVSYFSASGDFTKADPFFTQAVVNGILRGLANGEDGGNGVYAYGSSSIFPNNTSGTSNYFADVLFNPGDATSPIVTSVTPANNNVGVAVNIRPVAIFSKAIDPATTTAATVIMTGGPGNAVIPVSVSVTDNSKLTITPNADLSPVSTYTVTLKGGNSEPAIKDLLGNALTADYSWKFSTTQLSAPVITLDPVAQISCANSNVSFTSAATGTPTPTAQWQSSTDNGATWTNIPGATSGTYTFNALPANNNTQYRTIWSNSVDAIRSAGAVLTVSTAITGSISAVNVNICPNGAMQLQLSAATGPSPYTLVINSNTYTGITVGQTFSPVGASETIFASTDLPSEQIVADNNSVEVGVKFQSNKAGLIKGIRFYKGSAENSGTHIGSLWSQSGALLASATFTNESASGWQEVLFASPVSINSNTTYVASYFLPNGRYSRTGSYFVTSHSNGNSLTALQKTATETNAVYMYTSQSAFPSNNFAEPNYWVDVVFAAFPTATTTFNLTSVTANNNCSVSGNPLSSATISIIAPANAGTVSGVSSLCGGAASTYISNGNTGGTWISSNPAVATINAGGVINALVAGTTDITYSVNNGCGSTASAIKTLTVTPYIYPGTINGASSLCINATTTYTSNGSTGGTWSSSNPAVATVNATTGAVTGILAGTTAISYTVNANCTNPVSLKTITIVPNVNPGVVSGSSPICIGISTSYTTNGASGGVWKSSNTAVATINVTTGSVTAVAAGTTTISYSFTSGCGNTLSAVKTLTVNPNANAGNLAGSSPLCILLGSTTFVSDGDAGGTWSSSNPLVAAINSSGKVSALLVGSTVISYKITTGCNSPVTSTKPLSVNLVANAGTISGAASLCAGTISNYTANGDVGGTWTSSNTAIASVNSAGAVKGISAGSLVITYTVKGCVGSASATKTITVKPTGTCGATRTAEPGDIVLNSLTNSEDKNDGSKEMTGIKIEAFPNPSTSEFTLMLKGYGNSKVGIVVTDVMGKKVYKTEAITIQQYRFGKDFIPGVYLLEVISEHGKQTMKLIRQ